MAVRAFWERKATMFVAALQRLLALRVKWIIAIQILARTEAFVW